MTDIPEDLFSRAVAAYQRHCERNNFVYAQPAGGGEIDGDTITLSNMHGTLARYRWTGKRLEMLDEDD
jgi:hypothetical protein